MSFYMKWVITLIITNAPFANQFLKWIFVFWIGQIFLFTRLLKIFFFSSGDWTVSENHVVFDMQLIIYVIMNEKILIVVNHSAKLDI